MPHSQYQQLQSGDGSSKAYLVGTTNDGAYPVTAGAYQTTIGGLDDAFLTVIDTSQSGAASLAYSTFMGGKNLDVILSAAVDSVGMVYLGGYTNSTDFFVTPGAYQNKCVPNKSNGVCQDAFIA